MTEHDLMKKIQLTLSEMGYAPFRTNVGKVKMADGRFFDTGLPKGFSDIFCVQPGTGRAVFIEVKKPGGRVSDEQRRFIEVMKGYGAIAGVCYSVDEAVKLCRG